MDGDRYQERFDALAASGVHVHGEADFVTGLGPASVLDAGCGTGRVAIELARRGVEVVGADADPSMVATALRLAPDLTWVTSDLADLDLGRRFDVVVLAGNVPLFTPPGTRGGAGGGVRPARTGGRPPGGRLPAGTRLQRRGVRGPRRRRRAGGRRERWSTWDRDPFPGDGSYLVAVHRAPD